MKRIISTVGITLLFATVTSAQPRKLPAADDPYAEKPADPYPDPTPAPKPTKTIKADPKSNKPPPKIDAVDPYADPILAPPGSGLPSKTEADPYASSRPGKGSPKPPAKNPQFPSSELLDPGTLPVKKVAPATGPNDPYGEPNKVEIVSAIPDRIGIGDLTAVQGLLAMQRLDGWLLFDRDGENPIAARLVKPDGHPTRPWFVLLKSKGEPVSLVHSAELRSFDHVAGNKLTYAGYRDLEKQLKAMMKGTRTVAVEYSAKAAVPSVSRVDAGTFELIKATGVQVKSSQTLVQFTKAIWGDAGRTAHFIAVHHLTEMRKEALGWIAKQLLLGAPITEYDVQQKLSRSMTMRGLASTPPVVATGVNTADPYYVPSAAKTVQIKRGDLLVISLAAKVDKPDGVWAAQTWVIAAETYVAEPYAKAFEVAKLARDQALALITERSRKKRPLTGADVDDATRAFFKKAGLVDRVMHRTGHSIDNDLQGGGADLDNFEVKDTRILTPGTGFTIGPGLYFPGQFGVRTEVSVFLSAAGPEVTTPSQDTIEPLFPR